jgi:hypothetical protein
MTASIKHITINTGHARDSLAGEVEPRIVDQMAAVVWHMSHTLGTRLPAPLAGFHLSTPPIRGRCMLCWLYRTSDELFIMTIGVATEQACADKVWAELCNDGELEPEERDDTPEVPWVAVLLQPGLESIEPETVKMVRDFDRSLAWGFLKWLDTYEAEEARLRERSRWADALISRVRHGEGGDKP